MSLDISSCSWPIPDETSASGHIEQCLNFMKGCWQCTPDDGPCWCYMKRFWDMWGLEHGEVRVSTDLTPLLKRIESGFQLSSNLGMCSSHDPLHKEAIPVFKRVLKTFDDLQPDELNRLFNGHVIHICTKHPLRLIPLVEDMVIFDDDAGNWMTPRIWTSITTPSDEQASEYMQDVDSPFDMALAMRSLWDMGFDDLGVSFGPCFGAWREWDKAEYYLKTLPPLRMAQFEQMNHGNDTLDVLTLDEVSILAHRFKALQPQCKVFLKGGPYNVGSLLEWIQEEG